ncbi:MULTISPECIES: L,D-transpeptidase [Gardnerella]|uniref:L,D-transpeptidase n=1 Tax=Gardnerella TaxID=2701 RepID=UPI0007E311FC|nr:L,D-transpeptidase [Gardnerella sp. 26-12]PMC50790.1 murein L,D-transpeptidase [Gardnerella vaginalis]PMC54149.1 murein L,D-transpeptidase [Gardnerella vaginalis]
MAELQQNFEGDESLNITPSNMPDDASDDTVAFMQVPQSHVEDQIADNSVNYEGTLADNLDEVADEEDTSGDIVDDIVEDIAGNKKNVFGNNAASYGMYANATPADSTATDSFRVVEPKAKKHRTNRSALALMYSLLIFVILLAAAFFALHLYFNNRVAPGVDFGDASITRNLTGYQEDSVSKTVQNAVDHSELEISDDQGNSIDADLSQLGVKIDKNATVKAIMNAKRDNLFTRIMPWVHQTVNLKAVRDDSALDSYLLHKFIREKDRAVPYSAVFDKDSESYKVEDGIPGRTIETMSVREAVKKLIAYPGKTVKVSVTSRRTDAPIKLDAAQKLVNDLNKLLEKKITFNNGDGKDFTVPKEAIASWINIKADTTRRKLSYTIDADKADYYLSQVLPKELNQQKINQEDAIDKEGRFIFTTLKGSNGVEINYSNSVAKKAVESLRNGNDFKMAVPAKITKFTVEKKLVEMRIVVDKTTQTASVYKNDELVKTFPVCTGKRGADDSASGTFFIYLRYASQDMRGRNGDGSPYFSPGVRWVSYYHGGEGFHTASWNYKGIATGDAANHGSHGCINMYEQDARWIFENCPRGTIVQIVGTTPDGPVRE